MIDLSDIEAKARAATPGEWEVTPDDDVRQKGVDGDGVVVSFGEGSWHPACSPANAAYIAAASPAVILELVARLRAAEAKIEDDAAEWREHRCF